MKDSLGSDAQPPAQTAVVKDGAAAGVLLKELFPALFSGAAMPLKLRIQTDIELRAPGRFSRSALSAFLRRYTATTAYLIAITKATHRFDLDGQPVAELSLEHKTAAREALAERKARLRARETEMEAARRWRAEFLRDWSGTNLSRANFCTLKGIAEEALEALLEQAKTEASAVQKTPPHPAHRPLRQRERAKRSATSPSKPR
ncbi:ProQ/FINO family protein [Inhella sp.]|uniref:ProQ/FINO family protein n=1 Tax=Inhella sp. TaxID=1921806 RepID=UPI0035B26886